MHWFTILISWYKWKHQWTLPSRGAWMIYVPLLCRQFHYGVIVAIYNVLGNDPFELWYALVY